jgi:CheY-like chemotaxis protein
MPFFCEKHAKQKYTSTTDYSYAVTSKGNLKILLAEDNKVNQEVAVSMLSRQGYDVIIANNGEEVVKAVQNESFDLILMDVQMPLMNGYEATGIIRQMEKQTHRRIPIIGLTANAMNGDREKCIDAGMDDYLSKPVNMKNLLTTVSKMQNGKANSEKETSKDNTVVDLRVDLEELLEKLGGNKKTLSSCLKLFRQETASLLSNIDTALEERNNQELKIACHDLRGSLLTMEMQAALVIATKIGTAATENKFDKIKDLLPSLKLQIKEAVNCIENIL